jgi:signal transduction histidine kinase/ligand-binding sensor domain-containing protein
MWWTCVLVTCAGCSFALNPGLLISQYQKRNWQVEDGMPHNYVMTILPGPDRYMLIGTDEGLSRFDGVRFLPYDLDPRLGLSKRWVTATIVAGDGSLWVGTLDGGLYQWRNGKVITRVEKGASVFAILQDSSGRIWASTRNGVIRSQGAGFEFVAGLGRPSDTAWNVLAKGSHGAVWIVTNDGLFRDRDDIISRVEGGSSNGKILAVHGESNGEIEVGTSKGLFRIQESSDSTQLLQQKGVLGPVVAILRDRDGNLWAGTWGNGLYRVVRQQVHSWSSHDGLPDDFIRTLYEDSEGDVWIGTRSGGLSRWKDPILVPFGIPEGLRSDFAATVAQDPRGDLWLGTWRGGLYRFHNGKLARQPTPVPVLFLTVRALAIDTHGYVWIGNWEGLSRFDGIGYRHFAGVESPYRHVSAILFDRQGRLWIGTSDEGVFLFPTGEPSQSPAARLLPGQEITSFAEDAESNVWVGTSAGAGWISPANPTEFTPVGGLPHDSVAGLSEDARHRIWASTLGGALWQLSTSKVAVLDARNGLPGYPLYRALDDGIGSMWVSSPKGILRIPIDQIDIALAGRTGKLEVTTYDKDDGMRTTECHRLSQPAGGRDRKGNLWFPTSKGFVRIRPMREPSSPAPRVFIEEALRDGLALPAGQKIRCQPGSRTFEIRFTALNFSSPEKIRFRYRMVGFDPAWTSDSGTRAARYTELPPGDYRFLVEASSPGGSWSDPPAAIAVQQLPLFYQTRWFLLLLGLASAVAVAALFRWRVHIIKQRYAAVIAERNRIGREWHDTLVAGFSAISLQLDAALFRLGEPTDRVRDVLEVTRKIVHHYRAEARRVIWDLRDNRPDSESLVEAVSIALRQVADQNHIEGQVSIIGEPVPAPKDMEHNLLRICQEALSNAVRHGHPRKLEVVVQYSPSHLKVRIRDDGQGFDPAVRRQGLNSGHFGLTVMQERAQRLGGTLLVESHPGEGTVVEAMVPLDSAETK